MIFNRKTKLWLRRNLRRSKRQVGDIGEQAEENIERHFFRRLSRLYQVRRFVVAWVGLLVLLSAVMVAQTRSLSVHYKELRPVPGGIYTEGIIGAFTNANPLYAVGGVDQAVSSLVFSSLFKYDRLGNLVPEMAESYSVDETGRHYTVKLRDNLSWHDGEPLTSSDVVFTYKLIQNPDAKSPLFSSWQNVSFSTPDRLTITFNLPNSLTSFPHSLTNGLIPEHILKTIRPEQLRSANFNTVSPVGSGPFKWGSVEVNGSNPEERQEQIGLVPNESYYAGEPKLQRFIVRTYRSEQKLLKSFEDQEISAMSGIESVPEVYREDNKTKTYSVPLTGSVMVFFKNSDPLFTDVKVRKALIKAIDTRKIVNGLSYPAKLVDSPFLKSHISYDSGITQFSTNLEEANLLLDEAGWVMGNDGIRTKDGKKLIFNLQARPTSEFNYVAKSLQKQWRNVGVAVDVNQPSDEEFQSVVAFHNYQALLYGISLGTDPDIFAYWHSSQADPRALSRLNFSEYSSEKADRSLEGGRTRDDPALRAVKYKPFLEAWREDAPALALYQPRYLYVVRGGLYNFEPALMNSSTDRFTNVHNWMIRQAKAIKQ